MTNPDQSSGIVTCPLLFGVMAHPAIHILTRLFDMSSKIKIFIIIIPIEKSLSTSISLQGSFKKLMRK